MSTQGQALGMNNGLIAASEPGRIMIGQPGYDCSCTCVPSGSIKDHNMRNRLEKIDSYHRLFDQANKTFSESKNDTLESTKSTESTEFQRKESSIDCNGRIA